MADRADLTRMLWTDLPSHADRIGSSGWLLLTGADGLCDETAFAALDLDAAAFDWAASCGLDHAADNDPLSVGDAHLYGARAFVDGERATVALWQPAAALTAWFALTGGALLVRSASLQRALDDSTGLAATTASAATALPPEADRAALLLSRRGTRHGDRCAVIPELLALETATNAPRPLLEETWLPPSGQRYGRGARASLRRDETAAVVRWMRALQAAAATARGD